MSSEQYFRCGGCHNIVSYPMMQKHYESNHLEGLADASPRPAVANPPPMPMWQGRAIPPSTPEPKIELGFNLLLMKRSFPKTFWIWTIIVAFLTAWAVSSLYTLIVFHI